MAHISPFTLGVFSRLLIRQGFPIEAENYLTRALQADPGNLYALSSLNELFFPHKIDDLEKFWQRAIDFNKRNVFIYCEFSKLLIQLKKFDEAKKLTSHAKALAPSSSLVNEVQLNLYTILIASGLGEDALKYTLEDVNDYPESPCAHLMLCKVLISLGKFDEAIEPALKAVELGSMPEVSKQNPFHDKHGWIFIELCSALINSKRLQEAKHCVDKALVLWPSQSYHIQNALCNAFIHSDKPDEAKEFALEIVARCPSSFYAWMGLAKTQRMLRQFHEAKESTFNAFKINPELAHQNLLALCRAFIKIGEYDEAERCAMEAINLVPKLPYAYMVLCRTRIAIGKIEEAKESFFQTFELDQERAYDLHIAICNALINANKSDEAETYASQVKQIYPSSVYVHTALSYVSSKMQKQEVALQYAAKAFEMEPNSSLARVFYRVILYNCGLINEANSLADKATYFTINSAYINLTYGYFFLSTGDTFSARFYFKKAVSFDRDLVEALDELIKLSIKEGNLTDAEKFLQRLAELKPNDLKTQLNLSSILQRLGWLEQAKKSVFKALEINSQMAYSEHINLCTKLLHQDGNKAEEYAAAAAMKFPTSAYVHIALCRILFLLGKRKEAKEAAYQAITLNPHSKTACETHFQLCNALVELKEADAAEEFAFKAVELNPTSIPFLCTLSRTLLNLGKLSEAKKEIVKAIALDPYAKETHQDLVSIMMGFIKSNRRKEAEEWAVQLVQAFPLSACTHSNLSMTLLELGRMKEAVEPALKAMELDCELTFYSFYSLCLSFIKANEQEAGYRLAREALKFSDETNPKSAYIHIVLCQVMLKLGCHLDEDGLNHGLMAVQLNPNLGLAHANLCHLYLNAPILEEEGSKLQKARVHLLKSFELNNNDSYVHYLFGKLFVLEGKFNEASTSFLRALGININYTEVYGDLADLRIMQGDIAGAREALERVLKIDPQNDSALKLLAKLSIESVNSENPIIEGSKKRKREQEKEL